MRVSIIMKIKSASDCAISRQNKQPLEHRFSDPVTRRPVGLDQEDIEVACWFMPVPPVPGGPHNPTVHPRWGKSSPGLSVGEWCACIHLYPCGRVGGQPVPGPVRPSYFLPGLLTWWASCHPDQVKEAALC